MTLADLLITRPALFSGFKKSDGALRRELFEGLVRRGVLVRARHGPRHSPSTRGLLM